MLNVAFCSTSPGRFLPALNNDGKAVPNRLGRDWVTRRDVDKTLRDALTTRYQDRPDVLAEVLANQEAWDRLRKMAALPPFRVAAGR